MAPTTNAAIRAARLPRKPPSRGPNQLRQTEIQDLEPALWGKSQIPRLDVAVEYPFPVRRLKPLSQLLPHTGDLFLGQRPFRDELREGDAGDQLLNEEINSIVGVEVEHHRDVGMIELRKG